MKQTYEFDVIVLDNHSQPVLTNSQTKIRRPHFQFFQARYFSYMPSCFNTYYGLPHSLSQCVLTDFFYILLET